MHSPGRQSSLAQWLAWLETLHPKKIDLSLNRIRAVLEVLGLERPPFRVVAVGGTNGKGSCVAYLDHIYRLAGFCTGAFTSPHLVSFNERIAVNGVNASDAELVTAFLAMNEARDTITLSYFEASAVAAIIHFASQGVEVAVLEVGMGGRLDAVNAIDSDAALIASIGLDHEEWLGSDRESIGFEKAGIMRRGRPAVIADPDPPASIVTTARETGATALFIGEDFSVAADGDGLLVSCSGGRRYRVPKPGFGGSEQWLNVAACIQLIDSLAEVLPIPEPAVGAGIAATKPAGRADVRRVGGVEWIFDVAHNPAAAQRLHALLSQRPARGKTLAIFGALGDKDIAGVVAGFAAVTDVWLLVQLDADRAAGMQEVAAAVSRAGARAQVKSFDNVAAACAAAREQATVGDRIVVFGSFYVVGPALSALELYFEPPG